MAITGSVRRAPVGSDSTTQGVARGRRLLRLAVLAALAVALVSFGLLTVAYLLDPRSVHAVAGFTAAWWASFISVLVLAVAACVTDTDECEDGHYCSTVVEGLRAEWRRRG
ncbi:hypothetical protein [Solicola sp. PLA-1-18]|uniref:hypothetical protein n=1 Tax=Solicola sp. PLA-1-18 TaxID=3380532 RepID=UPI003B81FE96